jgi:hypothetical protein
VFVGWQLAFEVTLLALKTPLGPNWTYLYWLGHSLTYILLLAVFTPTRFKSLPGIYWLATLTLTILFVTNVWLYEPWRQYVLAVVCGALALFATIISYATNSRWLPRSTWAGVAVWSAGQVAAAALPQFYGAIYPVTCAVALALFLAGTYVSVPLYAPVVFRLDHARLPLSPRFFRRRLGWTLAPGQ